MRPLTNIPLILTVAALLLLTAACGPTARQQALLNRADSLMNNNPAAALRLTDSLLADGQGGSHWQSQLRLRRLKAVSKLDTVFTAAHVAQAKTLANHFDCKGTPNERMLAHYLLGLTLYDSGKLPDALEAYHTAAAFADTTNDDCDCHTLTRVHAQMAEIFHRHYQPRTAIAELTEAQLAAFKAGDTLMAIECYFDQSNEYERLGETDTAFAIATEAARLFTVMGHHDRAAAAKSSTVLQLLDQHRTAEAKAAIDAFLAAYTDSQGNVSPGREIFYYKRGLYYLQAGKPDSANHFFRKELRDGHDINNQIAGRKGLQMLYEQLGKTDSVAKYAAEGYRMSDSVYSISESQNMQSLQAMFDYTHHQLTAEQKTSELRNTRFYMATIVIALLLVLFIVTYLAQKRNKRHAIATASYRSTIRDLSLENRLGSSPIAMRLKEMANGNPPQIANPDDITSLQTLIDDNIPSFFETVNPPQLPLNEQEYLVCLLSRLALPSANIDRLTGVSEGYTSRLKSRIYRKVTGSDGTAKDFEHWIMSIK